MKLAFLLAHEAPNRGGVSFYRFVPYHYGPYSFTLQHELTHLSRYGLVTERENGEWCLTEYSEHQGWEFDARIQKDINWIAARYGVLSTSRLLEVVYERYPWYTVNSIDVRRRRRDRPVAELAVYTAGYEKLSIDGFLDLLLRSGISQVIDVRSNPISRQYGLHRDTLARLSRAIDASYTHEPMLGIPSHLRAGLDSPDDYASLFNNYYDRLLVTQRNEVTRIARVVREAPSALICMEANPDHCHRSRLADKIHDITALPIIHLGWPR